MPQRIDAGSTTWHLTRCRRVTAADCESALRALYDLCDVDPTVRHRIESPPVAATATDGNESGDGAVLGYGRGGAAPLGLLDPGELRERAAHLRVAVLDHYWVEDERGRFFALALDRDDEGAVRPLRVRASNMGHLLDSRLLDGDDVADRREAVVRALFAPDLLCAAGVRTLSAFEVRCWPAAYHNGSSWPWDTYVIARGLHRHGFHGLAWDLKRRVWEVCRRHRCFPEFTAGTDDVEHAPNDRILDVVDVRGTRNRLEQPPQEIQAWTVAAVVAAKAQWADAVLRRPGARPWRAVDPTLAAVEAELLPTKTALQGRRTPRR